MYRWWTVFAWSDARGLGLKLGPLTICWERFRDNSGGLTVAWMEHIVWDGYLRHIRRSLRLAKMEAAK